MSETVQWGVRMADGEIWAYTEGQAAEAYHSPESLARQVAAMRPDERTVVCRRKVTIITDWEDSL